jgi:hypothetical protein
MAPNIGKTLLERKIESPIWTTLEEANERLAECVGKLLALELEAGCPLVLVEIAEVTVAGKVITWRILLHEVSYKQETIDLGE